MNTAASNLPISIIAETLRQAYEPWAAQNNFGKVYVVTDLRQMWTQAGISSQTACVVICYTGDEARGDFSVAAATHRGDATFEIGFVRGKNMTSKREGGLTSQVQNAPAFYDLMEQARDIFRSLTNISQELYADYKSTREWIDAKDHYGNMVDAFIITGSVAMDYPELTNTPDLTTLPI